LSQVFKTWNRKVVGTTLRRNQRLRFSTIPLAGGECTHQSRAGRESCRAIADATRRPPASGAIEPIAQLSKTPDATIPGLAVSPDGQNLLLAQHDQNCSNIIMVERPR
jgi:hypothetical protein